MIIKLGLMMLFILIGVANYYLSKSFWCHEGVWGKDMYEQ
jgi:hypothetical protein